MYDVVLTSFTVWDKVRLYLGRYSDKRSHEMKYA